MRRAHCVAMLRLIIFLVKLSVGVLRTIFRNREELLIENLALRQQLIALKKKRRYFYGQLREIAPRTRHTSGEQRLIRTLRPSITMQPVGPEYSCRPWQIIMVESLNDWKFDNLAQCG